MLLDAEQSDTNEGYSSEEQEEAGRLKKPGKTPHKADKRRGDLETHYEVGPHHSGHREIRTDRHRRDVVRCTTNRCDSDGDNQAAAHAVRHTTSPCTTAISNLSAANNLTTGCFFNPPDEKSESSVEDLPILDSSTSTGPQTPSFSATANVEDLSNVNSTPLTDDRASTPSGSMNVLDQLNIDRTPLAGNRASVLPDRANVEDVPNFNSTPLASRNTRKLNLSATGNWSAPNAPARNVTGNTSASCAHTVIVNQAPMNDRLDTLMKAVADIQENLRQLNGYIQQHMNTGKSSTEESELDDFKLLVDDEESMGSLSELLMDKTKRSHLVNYISHKGKHSYFFV
jgi:hypothetical protein